MTVFSFLWLIIILYCFAKKGMRDITLATLIFMTFQCANVIEIGNVGVGPQTLTSLVYVAKYFIVSKGNIRIIKKREFFLIDIVLLLLIAEITYSSVRNGVFEDVFFRILLLISYVGCYLCMRRSLGQMQDEEIYCIVRKVIKFVVIVGVIQWVVTNALPSLRPIGKLLLYNDNSTNVYFNYNDAYHNKRVYAMFMEPSYLASFLVGGFYYLFSFKDKWHKNLLLMALILVEIILTTSSTAYGAFVIVGILFVLQAKQLPTIWKIVYIFIALGCAAVLYFGFYSLLDAVIFSKAQTGSGITRARWNQEAYNAYLTSPLFGVGYKAIRGSSIFYSLLGELGIIGLLLYVLFIIFSIYKVVLEKKINVNKNVGYYAAMYVVLVAAICQFIACPDLDMCSLWLSLYILAIYEGRYVQTLKGSLSVK